MKNLFKDQQVLAIIVGGVAATIITAWIMNPQTGPAGWIKGLSGGTQSFLSTAAIMFVIATVGVVVSLVASSYARTGALQPASSSGISGAFKMLFAPRREIPDTPPEK